MAIKISGNTVISDDQNIINIVDSTISGVQKFSNGAVEVVTAGAGSTCRFRVLGSSTNPTFEINYEDGSWIQISVGVASTTSAAVGVGQTESITPSTLRYVLDNRPSGIPIINLNSGGGYTVLDEHMGYLYNLGSSYSGDLNIPTGLMTGHTFCVYNSDDTNHDITCSGTLEWAGQDTTGTRSLIPTAVATCTHLGSNNWIISGAGLE